MDYLFVDRMRRLIATVPTDSVDGLCISSDDEIVTINGSRTLTLELTYSADTVLLAAKTGAIGNLVMYKDEDKNPVVMEIVKSVRDPLNYTYTLSADTAGADLIDETVDTYDADDEYTIDYYVDKFTWDSGWEIRLNQVTEKALKLKYDNEDETALARVLNVASDFGAELDFAFTIDTDHTVHKYIDIYAARGSQTNAELVRDINVNNVTSTTDIYDMFTSVKAKSDVNDADGNPITLKGMTWQSDDGRYVLGSDGILRDTVAVQKWSRILSEDNPDPSTHHLQRVKKYTTGLDTASDDNPKYKQYPDKVEAKNKDIASQKKKITATDAYIKSQNGYIAKKQNYIAECNARIAAYEKKQKSTYPAKKAAYLAKVKSLQAELAKGGTVSHIKSLESQIATQQRLAANQDKYAAKQSKYIAKQQAYIKAANAAIKGYKKKIADYNAKIKGYNATIDKDKKAIADLNAGKVALYNDVQSKTLDLALADLKAHNEPAVNYETDIALLPDTVRLGDTVHIVDDEEGTYLSSRVLQIETSRVTGTRVATMGNYLIEQRQAENSNAAIQAVFAGMSLSTYPWTRYADDDQGTGISTLPTGKSYMATIWGKTAVASDDPADYADHWALIKGEDGAAGTPGPAGADGRTPYEHIAWAQSVDGKTGFSTTSADRATYLGTCSDFTEADPTDPTAYTWAYFQGPQGKDGADAIVLNVSSVNGNMFKNTGISTNLVVSVTVGADVLTNAAQLHAKLGDAVYLQWSEKKAGELDFTPLALDDSRLQDEGFLFAVATTDVDYKSTFKCNLYE